MVADPETLLGRLQRGRGDAVRELLATPRAAAAEVVIASLCTLGTEPGVALRELVEALAVDVAPWLQWLEGLAASTDENDLVHQWNLVGALAGRGNGACLALLQRQVRDGAWWPQALEQLSYTPGLAVDAPVWRALAPRLDDATIASCVWSRPHDPAFAALARTDERFARIVAADRERRVALVAERSWSPAAYGAAVRPASRWRVLEDLLRQDPAAARPLVVDGLWDGSVCYRRRCIAHCDLDAPGVREHLRELAADPETADAVRQRLAPS